MQHSQARFIHKSGTTSLWSIFSGKMSTGGPVGQLAKAAGRQSSGAGIVQIAAKDNEICIDILQPVQHLDAVMQIRRPKIRKLLYACHILVSLIIALLAKSRNAKGPRSVKIVAAFCR